MLAHDRTESRKLGDRMGEVRQCTEAEEKLSNIYRMHGIIPHPLEKIQSVVHPKPPSKMTLLRISLAQSLTKNGMAQVRLRFFRISDAINPRIATVTEAT